MKKKIFTVLALAVMLALSMAPAAWAAGGYASLTLTADIGTGMPGKVDFSAMKMTKTTVTMCEDRPTSEEGVYIHNEYSQGVTLITLRRGSRVRISSGLAEVGSSSLYIPFVNVIYENGAYHFVDGDRDSAKLYAGTADDNFAVREGFMSSGIDEDGNRILIVLEDDGSQKIKIKLNGKRLNFPQAPYMANDTTMVPMRAIFEALDAAVEYDAASQKITATKGDTVIELVLGEKAAKKNGEGIALDAPAVTKNGNTMVPLRFVAEALQAQVDWDNASQTITITLE